MKGRSLLALSLLSLALACEGSQQATGPNAPDDASKIIRDGAHSGGNKDFFFLPPMVPLPLHNPDFQLGKFNNALGPSLKVVICELNDEYNAQHVRILPTDAAVCVTTKKTFAPGSVQLVNLPLRQNGWWTLFGLPPDGFYYVLWDTRQSNLQLSKYYRIKVFVEGKSDELGIADVDPMGSLREWKYSLTGDVIQLVDDVMLPITFRVEQGALCATGTTCTSATYTNTTPLTLPFDPDLTGSTAGVTIPAGALPTPQNSPTFCTVTNPCPTTVTVKITKVNTDGGGEAAPTLCHPDIPGLQQFKGCYEFTTIPELRRLNELGDQFVSNVLVAVCYELEGSGDPREKFAQLYQSGVGEPSKFLDDVHEGVLIGADTQDCTPPVVGSRSSNPLIQFASSGWRAVKGGLGKVFGVKTAYAIDLGLGGLTKGFSHISPVLRVGIAPASPTNVTLNPGELSTDVSAKIVAQHFHTEVAPNVGKVPVTFAVTEGNGRLKLLNTEGPGTTSPVTLNTAFLPDGVTPLGTASVTWILPGPGTYTMTATGPATGGPITYTATAPAVVGLGVLRSSWVNENQATAGITSLHIEEEGSAVSVEAWGQCEAWDCPWGATSATTTTWSSAQQIVAFWDQGFATRTQTITYLSANRLQVVTFSHFQPGDPREDYTLTEYFVRPELSVLNRGWVNQNSENPGITGVSISVNGSAVSVQAWGNCSPNPCDWGQTSGNTSKWSSDQQIVAFWDQGYATRTQTITFLAVDYIKVVTFTDFTPEDGRTDYTLTEYFKINT